MHGTFSILTSNHKVYNPRILKRKNKEVLSRDMADSQTAFGFRPSYCFQWLCVLSLILTSTVDAGCIRTRRSGITKELLRQELRRVINDLYKPFSFDLSSSTFEAFNYTKLEYSITDSCNPICESHVTFIMKDMNLTRSSLTNASGSTVLEFYRRVLLGFNQELIKSLADLSRAQNGTTSPTYLEKLQDMVRMTKDSVTRAVNLDRKLKDLAPLNTGSGQQSFPTAMRKTTMTSPVQPRSLSSIVCRFSRCVLENLLEKSYEMSEDFFRVCKCKPNKKISPL